MGNDRWQRVKAIFTEVASVRYDERAARIDSLCGDDAALRREVTDLLGELDRAGGTILSNVQDAAAEALAAYPAVTPGKIFGAWRLGEVLGRGGMAAVFHAERVAGDYEQQAAIKIISPGLMSPAGLARFEEERQILARLQHKYIARLIDGGTTDEGLPWLAMEYIDGERIDQYCRTNALDLRSRLVLFSKVCAAVQDAHRNLLVHRDIKPTNILVDRIGDPKLLDFGVAKLFEQGSSELTVAGQRALTPRYASPEQLHGHPLTTATDIYSLSVLLFELLAGTDPYGVDTTDSVALQHAICDGEREPPSSAVERSEWYASDAALQNRVARELRGDLDTIVLKGLRLEPERRYESVQALADDIDRYLSNQPVLARPDTWGYRAAKFLRRHRAPLSTAAVMLAVIAAGSVLFVQRIVAERDAAEAAQARAEEMSAFLQQLLRGADRFKSMGEEVTLRDILERGAERVRTELADQPVEQARMMQTIADTYHALSMFQPALEMTRAAFEIRRRELGPRHLETLQSMRGVGLLMYLSGGDIDAAIRSLEEARDLQIDVLGAGSHEVAATRRELGTALRNVGAHSRALEEYRIAYDILVALPPGHEHHRYEADLLNQAGNALDALGETDEALASYEQALGLLQERGQDNDPLVGALLNNIGLIHRRSGRLDDALPFLEQAVEHTRRILGEESEDYEVQLSSLGRTLSQVGQFEKANEYLLRASIVGESLYGTDHPYYAWGLVNIARLRQLERKHDEARVLLERAIAIYRDAYGDYHPFLAAAEVGLSDTRIELGDAAGGAALVGETLERMREVPDHEKHVEALGRGVLGRALGRLGRSAEALALLEGSVASLRELLGDEHQLTAQAAIYLVDFLEAGGDGEAAAGYRPLTEPLARIYRE